MSSLPVPPTALTAVPPTVLTAVPPTVPLTEVGMVLTGRELMRMSVAVLLYSWPSLPFSALAFALSAVSIGLTFGGTQGALWAAPLGLLAFVVIILVVGLVVFAFFRRVYSRKPEEYTVVRFHRDHLEYVRPKGMVPYRYDRLWAVCEVPGRIYLMPTRSAAVILDSTALGPQQLALVHAIAPRTRKKRVLHPPAWLRPPAWLMPAA